MQLDAPIKRILRSKRITAAYTAEYCGVSRTTVSNIWQSKQQPKLRLAQKMAELAGVPTDEAFPNLKAN